MILTWIQGFVYLESVNYQLGLHRNVRVLAKCNVCISAIQMFYIQTCPGLKSSQPCYLCRQLLQHSKPVKHKWFNFSVNINKLFEFPVVRVGYPTPHYHYHYPYLYSTLEMKLRLKHHKAETSQGAKLIILLWRIDHFNRTRAKQPRPKLPSDESTFIPFRHSVCVELGIFLGLSKFSVFFGEL